MSGTADKQAPAAPRQISDAELQTGAEAAHRIYELTADAAPVSGLLLKDADLTGEDLTRAEFYGCTLEGCRFTSAVLERASFTDCVLRRCEFSGALLEHGYFKRCVWEGCRMLGARAAECSLHDVLFSGCVLDMSTFREALTERVQLKDCSAKSCDFSRLKKKVPQFAACDLSGAVLAGTSLKGCDLRGCGIDNITLSDTLYELRGAVLDVQGAASVAALLGAEIR